MSRVALILLCVAAAASAGTVTYRPLTFGGEAENGVFAADVDGDGARDLVAFGHGRISVYRGRKGAAAYPAQPETILTGAMAYFADVADVTADPGLELVVITAHGVGCFIQQGGKYITPIQPLLKCETILSLPLLRGAVANTAFTSVDVLPWNFAFDADGDGRDDVLVPHGTGTDVYLATAPGKFAKPIRLRLFPLIFHGNLGSGQADDIVGHNVSPVHLEFYMRDILRRDVNGDGKLDLACRGMRGAPAVWFAQKHDGGFDPVPASLPPGFRAVPDRSMVDINGDGRIDRIAEENRLDDPFNIKTHVRYWLADANGNLPAKPTTINDQNILVHTHLPVHDFDGDGALDFAMFKTDITATEVAKWVRQSFGKIDGYLNLYLFDRAGNRYDRRPVYSKSISMRFQVDLQDVMIGGVWERYLGTMMRFEGDYNGDKRLDLLVRDETHRIAIYFNTGTRSRLFSRGPDIQLEDLPMFGGLEVEDLNGDGCADLILSASRMPFTVARRANVIAVYISQRR